MDFRALNTDGAYAATASSISASVGMVHHYRLPISTLPQRATARAGCPADGMASQRRGRFEALLEHIVDVYWKPCCPSVGAGGQPVHVDHRACFPDPVHGIYNVRRWCIGCLFLMFEDLVQTGRIPAAILRNDARTDIWRAQHDGHGAGLTAVATPRWAGIDWPRAVCGPQIARTHSFCRLRDAINHFFAELAVVVDFVQPQRPGGRSGGGRNPKGRAGGRGNI